MAATSKDILVIGATGVIGKFITNALVENNASFGRLGIFTSPGTVESKATEIQRLKIKGVNVYIGDIKDDEAVLNAYKDFDTVVSAVGRNVIAEQIRLIELAEKSGTIKRFFPSEYGTDIEYWPNSVSEKPHQQKLKVRNYIKENVKKLEYTYVVTGPYADLYIGNLKARAKAGAFDPANKKAILLGTGNEKISLTTMSDVGKLVVAALTHPEESRNAALKVNSYTTTPNEILKEFEKQTGAKWDVGYTSLADLEKLEKEAWEKSDPLATVYTLRRIWTQGGTLYEVRDNEKIGAGDTETLEHSVRQAVQKETAAFQSGEL